MATSPPPPSNALLDNFDTLDQTARRSFLRSLCHRLRPSDWWFLNEIFIARDSRIDLIARLPNEIAISIFEYLEPTQAIRARAVSKCWNAILRADSTCSALVRRWYGTGEAKLSEHPEGLESQKPWAWVLENTASRYEAIRSATPSTRWILRPLWETVNPAITWFEPEISFMGQYAACINYSFSDKDGRSFEVIDIVTRRKVIDRYYAPSRGILRGIYLMKSYVMVTTHESTKCFVWNLSSKERRSIRLPSTSLTDVTADENLLVFGFWGQDDTVVYNATSNKVTAIKGLFSSYRGNASKFVLNALTEQVVHFGSRSLSRPDLWEKSVYSTRTGDLIMSETFVMPQHRFCEGPGRQDKDFQINRRCGEDLFLIYESAWAYPPTADDLLRPDSPKRIKRGGMNAPDGVCTYAVYYDRKTGSLLHQRLHFDQLFYVPNFMYVYDGTIYTQPTTQPNQRGILVATFVPMDTGPEGKFLVVRPKCNTALSVLPAAWMLPLHTVSQGLIAMGTSEEVFHTAAVEAFVYRGCHELEEVEL